MIDEGYEHVQYHKIVANALLQRSANSFEKDKDGNEEIFY